MLTTVTLLLAAARAASAAVAASRPPTSTIEPSLSQIEQSEATATALSPVSNVQGLAFNRFIQVWLENTDYESSAANKDQQYFASQGILLSNYLAVTHPSEPNYCAAAGGDTFGMDNDDFNRVPANVSTVVDLLDLKGISWAEYQEHIPYPGFEGFNYSNQETYANDYVRKHNPLVLYDSVTGNSTRRSLIKGFDAFDKDVKDKTLPQWAFVTPNMTNDAHDTNITFASTWERNWLKDLLNDEYFMKDTLLILSYDEDATYAKRNKVFTVLLGGAIPNSLKGTTDDTFYTHYSTISTVSANWGLPSLGRWDCGANIFALVANKTGYVNYEVDDTTMYFNSSYPGPLSDDLYSPVWPVPETSAKCAAGHGVLPAVKALYGNQTATMNYTSPYPYDAKSGTDVGGSASRPSSSSTASPPTVTKSAGFPKHGKAPLHQVGLLALVLSMTMTFVL